MVIVVVIFCLKEKNKRSDFMGKKKLENKTEKEDLIEFPSKNCFLDERRPCSDRCRWRNDNTEDCRFLELVQLFVRSQFSGQQVEFGTDSSSIRIVKSPAKKT